MKILLAMVIALVSLVSPLGHEQNANNPTIDPVFFEFAPSFKSEISLENMPDSGWEKLTFPHNWFMINDGKKDKFHAGYYKGEIDFDGKGLLYLHFEAVNFKAELWINGHPAGSHIGGYLPFELDITGLLNIGKNEVILGTQDYAACFNSSIKNPNLETEDSLLHPIGSGIQLAGMWLPSKIIRRPKVFIENCQIDTSVSEKTITVKANLKSKITEELEFKVNCHIETTAGVKVLDFCEAPITLGRNDGIVEFSNDWDDPKLWSPENPNLYNCVIGIYLGKTKIHETTEIFGFRDFEIKGPDFYLNGRKINLRAASKHLWKYGSITAPIDTYAQNVIDEAKDLNCNILRLHANPFPEVFLDLADEKGIMIVNESAAFTHGDIYDLDSKLFWINLKNAWNDHIKRDYNHPSWVIASVENELLFSGGNNSDSAKIELSKLGKHVKKLSGRHIMFDGDGDPDGSADIINLHYSFEPTAHHTYPQDAYFLEDDFFVQSYPRGQFRWNREKPIYMGEFLWLPDIIHAGPVSMGDSFYEDIWDNRLNVKAKYLEFYLKAFRLQNIPAMNPWNPLADYTDENIIVPDTVRDYFKPVRFFVTQIDTHHFGGREIFRTITIQNWSEKPEQLRFKWSFGEQSGDWEGPLQPYEEKIINIKLELPKAEKREMIQLVMTLSKDSEVIHNQTLEISVYPYKSRISGEFLLVGNNQGFEESLKNLGYKFTRYVNLSELKSNDSSDLPVVLDPNSIEKDDPIFDIIKHDSQKYLILYPQNHAQIPLIKTFNDTDFADTFPQDGFTMTSWVQDFGQYKADELMEFFAGDNIIARDAFSLSSSFPMIPVLSADSGFGQFYPIVEIPGFGIMSAVAFSEKMSSEPRCSLIFEELISRLTKPERNEIPLVCDEPYFEILSTRNGFSPVLESAEKSVYYFGKKSKLSTTNLNEIDRDSTVILDRLTKNQLHAIGINCDIKLTPPTFSGNIKLDKSFFPSLTRGMLVSAANYKYNPMHKIMYPLGKNIIRNVSKKGYKTNWIVPNYLVFLTSESGPDILINLMCWGEGSMIPLHQVLLELGVKTQIQDTRDKGGQE